MGVWRHSAEVPREEEQGCRVGVMTQRLRTPIAGLDRQNRHLRAVDICINKHNNIGSGDGTGEFRRELGLRSDGHAGKAHCLDAGSYDASGTIV